MSCIPSKALAEEISFFRDICGWSDERITERLGLNKDTLGQKARRAAKRKTEQPKLTRVDEAA